MSEVIAFGIFAILAVAAVLHIYWAAGGLWPGRDEKSLARTVVGSNGIEAMPPRWITGLVSVGIFLAGLWPMFWLGWIDLPLPSWLITAGMIVLTLIFAGRGVAGFVPAVRRANAVQPFATLDRRYFSPLIVAIGLGLTYLLVAHWSAS